MERPTLSPEKVVPTPKHKKSLVFRLALIAFGILLACIVFILATAGTRSKKVVWLTQGDLHAGNIEKLRDALMRLSTPLWRGYWSRQPIVMINSTMLATPDTSAAQFGLGLPSATNEDGLQAWTLTAPELKSLRQRFKTLPSDVTLVPPPVQAFAGGWASVSSLNAGSDLTVTLRANANGNAWVLTTGATLTEPATSASTKGQLLRTNFAAACRATIPNAGALVIQSAYQTEATGTNFWLIVSPVAIDAQGKPIPR